MQSLYITIERQLEHTRPSSAGARFRVKVRAQPQAPALLMSTRNCQSVAHAKREAEVLFGEIAWKDEIQTPDNPFVRASGFVEIE
jgi:hypothetical protein